MNYQMFLAVAQILNFVYRKTGWVMWGNELMGIAHV